MFSDLMTDVVFIVKANGKKLGPLKTALSATSAQIMDATLDVDEGDKLTRELHGGKVESYTILEATFTKGGHGIPSFFDLTLKKDSSLRQADAPKTQGTTINIHNSTGVQVGNHNVINIQNALNELIEKIDASEASITDKQEAKGRLAALLSHPVVAAVLGGVAGSLPGLLGG